MIMEVNALNAASDPMFSSASNRLINVVRPIDHSGSIVLDTFAWVSETMGISFPGDLLDQYAENLEGRSPLQKPKSSGKL